MVPASSLASEQRIPAGSWEETVDFEGAHSGPILHSLSGKVVSECGVSFCLKLCGPFSFLCVCIWWN